MNQKLGEILNVNVKKVWPHEQYDFTPWLAVEENIAKLGAAIGMELEVDGVEVKVGPYSADILARELTTDQYVVIENQYGKTNHDHLGKLITYGAFLDAGTVIWLAERFTEEHKKALDWLNDYSTEELSYFGVAIELWQIDGSAPAVHFNVVSRPNVLVKTAHAVKEQGKLTEAKQLQLEFWTAFRDRLLEKDVIPSTQTPAPRYWFDVALGKSGVYLSNVANTTEGRLGVRVYLQHENADAFLEQLEGQKQAIETELNEQLQWNPNPENTHKVIALYRDVDWNNRELWPDYVDWMVERVAKFRNVFGPRVKQLP